jgi:prepilin-type processing-associated H-X9-DG protein
LANRFLIGPTWIDTVPSEPAAYSAVWVALRAQLANLNVGRVDVQQATLALMGDYGWWIALPFTGFQRYEWHEVRNSHNLAFLDGHVEFLKLRRGYYVTADVNTIHRQEIANQMLEAQDANANVSRRE